MTVKHRGIVSSDGPHWQEHRRFAVRTLRNFGFAKTVSLEAVHLELRQLMETLGKRRGRPALATKIVFTRMTINVISSIVFGSRLTDNGPRSDEMLRTLMEILESSSSTFEMLPNLTPWLAQVPLFMPLFNMIAKRTKNMKVMLAFIEEKIKERMQSAEEIGEPRDFTEALLLHRQSLEAQGQTKHTFDVSSMAVDLLHLLAAGTDAAAVTLTWGCVLLAINSEVQTEAREEILDQLGAEKLPTMEDRSKLNYTLAVIDEIDLTVSSGQYGHQRWRLHTSQGHDRPPKHICRPYGSEIMETSGFLRPQKLLG